MSVLLAALSKQYLLTAGQNLNNAKSMKERHHLFQNRRQQKWFGAILGLYFCLAIAYNLASPLFETPDEHHHYAVVQHLAATGELPVAFPNIQARQEAAQPPLYYVIGALLLAPFDTQFYDTPLQINPFLQFESIPTTQNVNAFIHAEKETGATGAWSVHWLRFYSTVLGAGTLVLIYATACLVWPHHSQRPLLAMSLVAFWPQFLFIHSSVSNDGLITLLSTAVLYQLIWLWRNGVSNVRLFALSVTIGLAVISKMTGLLLLPLAVVAAGVQLWNNGRSPKHILWVTIAITLSVLSISGWLFWRNWQLYGDVTAVNQFVALAGGERPYTLRQVWHDMSRVWQSLFAFFGWVTVRSPRWVYGIWNGFVLLAGAGCLWTLVLTVKKREAFKRGWSGRVLEHPALWLSGWLLLVVSAWLRFMLMTPADQGRLWFPAILPMALGLAFGLTQWRWRWIPVGVSGLALVTAVTGVLTIQQAYSLPPTLESATAIPDSATRLDARWNDEILLLAVEMEQKTAVAGEWVWATLYWQTETVPTEAPIIELHALGRGYELVGQMRTYHGGGHYPANLWATGQIVADRIGIRLNPTMQTPTQVRLMLLSDDDSIFLGQLNTSAAVSLPVTDEPLAHIGDDILLLQANPSSIMASPGEVITVTLGWQAVNAPQRPLTAFVHMGDPEQPPVAQMDKPPLAYDYPPEVWQSGDIITDTYTLTIPSDLDNGRYPLQTGMYDSETAVRLPIAVNTTQQPHEAYQIDWIIISNKTER